MSLSRRLLLGAAPAALLAPQVRGQMPASDPAGFKLGVASYSFRKLSRAQAIDGMKALNTSYINIKDFHLPMYNSAEMTAAGRKEFDRAGLTVLGGGNINLAGDDESLRRAFEYAKAAGFPLIVCAPSQANMGKVEKLVKEYDIKAAIHNHGPEDKHFPTPQSVLKLVKDMDPRMGLCIDIGHTTRTGVDVVESIAEAGPRLLDMHVKDLRDLMGKDSQCEVGDGKMPIAAIFRQLRKMNYTGGVMLEYEINADNPLPGMVKSFAYMRGVMAGMRG